MLQYWIILQWYICIPIIRAYFLELKWCIQTIIIIIDKLIKVISICIINLYRSFYSFSDDRIIDTFCLIDEIGLCIIAHVFFLSILDLFQYAFVCFIKFIALNTYRLVNMHQDSIITFSIISHIRLFWNINIQEFICILWKNIIHLIHLRVSNKLFLFHRSINIS